MSAAKQRSPKGYFINCKVRKRLDKIKSSMKRFHDSEETLLAEEISADEDKHENETSTENVSSIFEGRRIVEFDALIKGLICQDCGGDLLIQNTKSEIRFGLASLLYIECKCGVLNTVPTGIFHRESDGNRGFPVYDVNTKTAAAMLHAGLGPTHVVNFLSAMNIPPMTVKTLKRREREIGPVIEDIAKKSCSASLEEEVEQTRTKDNVDIGDTVELTASYDMGWQRRSSGRVYNSKSGHACLIGANTGSIIAYGSRKSSSRICETANKDKVTARQHDCRYNWSGTAKAMESSVGVELLSKTCSEQSVVKYIVMNDDSTTLSHIRNEFDPDIVKWSDINHAKKSLTNRLYQLKSRHSKLSTKVISHLKKCYSYVLAQNKNNVDAVRDGLRSITPHVFGNHQYCKETWCGYMKCPETYKYRSLPRGKCLTGEDFQADNESFNNTVASKAPKNRHYSFSESFDYRLGAAVSQKNIGPGYLLSVYNSKQISPGKALVKRAKAMQREAMKRKSVSATKTFKSRRLQLADNRSTFNREHEVREGPTYESNIDISNEQDVTRIPDPITLPETKTVTSSDSKMVFFDLETSSSEWNTEICQISAVADQTNVFNRYILPTKPMSVFASNVTKLTVHENTLLHKGLPVVTVTKEIAFKEFFKWLKLLKSSVVLVGHNVKSFDSVHLLRVADECGLVADIEEIVVGFIDTLPHFRSAYPNLKCHKEEFLVQELLKKKFDAHNSLADCIALSELVALNNENIYKHSFDFEWAVSHMQVLQLKHENVQTYSTLIVRKVISKAMAEKSAASGLRLSHLQLAFIREGEEGLSAVLSAKTNGKIRVTNRKPVIEKLVEYFEDVAK